MINIKRLVVAVWYAFVVMLMPGFMDETLSKRGKYSTKDNQL